jgi:hypothetical protein
VFWPKGVWTAAAVAGPFALILFLAFLLGDGRVRDQFRGGGVWANNPAVVAVSEAVSEFGIDLADIRLKRYCMLSPRYPL